MKYTAITIDKLPELAKTLLEKFPDKKLFSFNGELGSGKTTFIKEICNYFEVSDNVSSPTFSIINEYFSNKLNNYIYHIDLYRINNIEELKNIGFEDYIYSDNYCFVEWAERAGNLLPLSEVVTVDIFTEDTDKRTIEF